MSRIGRPGGEIEYKEVNYNSKDYVVGTVISNYEPVHFVFDKEDLDKVHGKQLHKCSNNYISSSVFIDGKKKELFLHNLIMNKLDHPGKGAKESIDHINRIGFDNRKENLRLITQSQQNQNQTKRVRSITLPEGCGVDPSEIPRHIWYIRANGAHGDRFAIEFKTEGLCWKTTSSKKVSLADKLREAKGKLQEFYKEYPHLNPFQEEKIAQEEYLKKSFEEIIKIANTETS